MNAEDTTVCFKHLKQMFTTEVKLQILAKRWEYGLPLGEWVIEAVEYTVWLWIDCNTTTRIANKDVARIGEFVWEMLYSRFELAPDYTDLGTLYKIIQKLEADYHPNEDYVDTSNFPEDIQRKLIRVAAAADAAEAARRKREEKKRQKAKKEKEKQNPRPAKKAKVPVVPPRPEIDLDWLNQVLDEIETAITPPDLTEIVARVKYNGMLSHDALPIYQAEKEKMSENVEILLPRLRKILEMAEEIVS